MQFPEEYQQLDPTTGSCVQRHAILIHLRNDLISYLLKRNAEPEVVDLLMEIEDVRDVKEDLRKLEGGDQSMSEVLHHHLRAVVGDRKAQILVNNRICQYLVRCVYMGVSAWVCRCGCVYMGVDVSVSAWVCLHGCVHECVYMGVSAWVCLHGSIHQVCWMYLHADSSIGVGVSAY